MGSAPVTLPISPVTISDGTGSEAARRPPTTAPSVPAAPAAPRIRARGVLVVVGIVVVIVVIVVASSHLFLPKGGGSSLPGVLSVLPESSNEAVSIADSLANNTTGGPWSPQYLEGWANTEGLSQVPTDVGSASCPVRNAAISSYGVLSSTSNYSAGYAAGWFVALTSVYDGASNLFVWVGDGTAYEIGELVGASCALVSPLSQLGGAYSSTGIASAAFKAANYTGFVRSFATANATYLLTWEPSGHPPKGVPVWTISFDACNGTIPYAGVTVLYGSNGSVESSVSGAGPGALCGSVEGVAPGSYGEGWTELPTFAMNVERP
jgi:hypothetical protein